MRQTISGLVAALAVVAASAVPAMACGLFQGSCSPCGQAYVSPCAQPQAYVAPVEPVYSGCNSCGWAHERLPDPVQQYEVAPAPRQQYYYVDQGPSYTGPGNFAPYPTYREGGVTGWHGYHHHPYYYGGHHYRSWHEHTGYRYGYAPHHVYGPRYGYHTPMGMTHHYGYREHTLRRYY
jgi:hypothetical protein